MKKTLFLLLTFCLSSICCAQKSNTLIVKGKRRVSKVQAMNKDVQVIWIAPFTDNIALENGKVRIEVEIASPNPIDQKDIMISLNEKAAGAKADEIKFGNLNKKQTKFTFSGLVDLVEGTNKLEVLVKPANNDNWVRSFPKRLEKDGLSIKEVLGNGLSDGAKGIFWQQPRWQSNPIVQEQHLFKMKVLINSSVQLKKSDIYVLRQNIAKIPPAPDSKLKRLSPGKYVFTNTVQLTQEGIQQLEVKVKSTIGGIITSNPILVNFSPHRPNIHLLAVGTQTNLDYTMNDAQDFAQLYQNQESSKGGRLYNTVHSELLIGEKATASNIKGSIEQLETKFNNGGIGDNDLIILYLSSHGFIDRNGKLRIQGDDYDSGQRRTTSVSYEYDIVEVLNLIPCKKLIFIDACYSGGSKGDNGEVDKKIRELSEKRGFTTIVSSRGNEASYEDDVWQNGAFTEAIVEGLFNARADEDKNRFITINELWHYIRDRVPLLVERVKNKPQHPSLLKNDLGDASIFSVN
ncbi:MAG: caspase family protein [Bacteroidota bacterium]